MRSLQGKVVLITGGAGFLGSEWARVLIQEGARVVLLDIASQRALNSALQAIREGVKDAVGDISATRLDITDEQAVARSIASLVKKYGRIDILINAAALNPVPGSRASAQQFSPYERYPLDLWRRELEVGLTGTLIMTQAVARVMMKRRSGSIINISSIYGVTGPDNRLYKEGTFKSIGYATVKGALLNFTRAWAAYLGPYNVRVNCLVLGGVFNGQRDEFVRRYSAKIMLGSMADKSDFNSMIELLASDASRHITGSIITIDGGWSAW